uniref:Putative plant transposon protein domain-containing protein n=1 Tax=Solanum tuberosum TaxID=4113 RepID=M1D8X1_SOLTU
MSKIMTQLHILSKNVMGAGARDVNVRGVECTNLEEAKFEALYSEEVNFLANQGGGYRSNYLSSSSGEELGSKSDADLGSQSHDGSGGSAESESGSQEDTTTSPPAIGPQAGTRAQREAGAVEGDDEVTPDDTMVQYVHLREFDPVVRQHLIDCFRSLWTVNRSKEFFEKRILNKSGGFRKRPLMLETRVMMAEIQAFPEIYRLFVNISEETINRMLHGPEYTTPAYVRLFEGKHHIVTKREAVAWVSDPHVPITKASLTFLAKIWWSIVRAQLRPTTNSNTLSPSLASLVAYLMAGYLVNMGQIISTEMRDRALNEREGAVGPLVVVPHTPVVIPQVADQTEQGESSQPASGASSSPPASTTQAPERNVLAVEKSIKDEMRKKLVVLKNRMDASSSNNEEFKKQLAEMLAQVAKLAEKLVQVPTPVMLESLMKIFSEQLTTQSLDNLWGNSLRANLERENTKPKNLMRRSLLTLLAGASGSRVPAQVSGSQSDPTMVSKSAPIDKGANVDPDTGA